jgi:signal transduction histidine kinase
VVILEDLNQAGGFVEEDLVLLQHLANVASLWMENARLRDPANGSYARSEADRLKAEAISFLAHEMRTPLTSIKGYATALLMDEVTFSPEKQREFIQRIDAECDTLVDLIHDILESSIIDAGLMTLDLEPVMLARLAEGLVQDFAERLPKYRFLVEFPQPFSSVEADPDRLAQVLRNLVDNAVKYSPQGGLIVVRGEVRPHEVVVSVADQGIGIAPEHLNRLFDKFFRIKEGPSRGTVGSGLGLPIARTIVESHGGRIWAESRPGEGSTFYFTLPLREANEELSGV